jgi:hypothetical protein
MSFVGTFLPWIVKSALTAVSVPLALGVSLALSVIALWKDGYIIEWVTFLCFLVDGLCFVSCLDSHVCSVISVFDTIALTFASWGSVCVHKPLTMHYARAMTPSKFWTDPLFFKVNSVMTTGLGAFFFLEMLAKVAKLLNPEALPYVLISCVFKVGLVLYIAVFPKWYKQRVLKARNN